MLEVPEFLGKFVGIGLVGLTFAIEFLRSDDDGVGTKLDKIAMVERSEPASFLNTMNLMAKGDDFFDKATKCFTRMFALVSGVATINHDRDSDVVEFDVEADVKK